MTNLFCVVRRGLKINSLTYRMKKKLVECPTFVPDSLYKVFPQDLIH